MSKHIRAIALAACAAAAVALTAAKRADPAHEDPAEIARLRTHFDSVLSELRGADVTALSAAQRAARATLIARLESYARAERFPHNHVRPGTMVPVFRDGHGTLCAMGYLITSTGRTDIVDDVARSNNLALIPALAADARLRAWLDSTGLTVAEAARIQPTYDDPRRCFDCVSDAEKRVDYAAMSMGITAMSGSFAFANIAPGERTARQTRIMGLLGVAAGGAQTVYGVSVMRSNDPRRLYGYANLAIGGGTIAASVWRLRHPLRTEPTVVARVSVAPYMARREAGLVIVARM